MKWRIRFYRPYLQHLFNTLILSASDCAWGKMLDKLVVEPLVPKLSSSEVHITIER